MNPWDNDPVANAPQAAPQAATAPSDAPWANDATAAADAPPAASGGFTDEEKQAILHYLPKAKDAADLEQFASELTNGRSHIGNAADVIAAYNKGHRQFAWEAPTPREEPINVSPNWRDRLSEAILRGLDMDFPGVGTFLRTLRDNGSGGAAIAHVANAAGADYGPEIGGFLQTLVHPSQYGDFGTNLDRNVEHGRAQLHGLSAGHPIASTVGELAGVGLTAPLTGEALAGTKLAELPGAVKAATGGAIYGSGAGGPDHRIAGAVTGAALGAATDAATPYVIKALTPAAKTALSPEAADAANAAQDLGVSLPRYALSDKDRAAAGALEQTPFGRGPIANARTALMDTSEAARNRIAGDLGTPAETHAQLGDQALDAAVKANKANRAAGGALYDAARAASSGAQVAPKNTLATVDSLLADESQKIGGSKIAPVLQSIRSDLKDAGSITVQQARDLRTTLREQLSNEAGATPDNADRITNTVMSAVNADMKESLPANAYALYQRADANWAQQRQIEDEVLKPFLGKNFDNWGEDVAKKINSDAKGNGTRLARFLATLPESDANNVRASLIQGLGKASDGTQNAAGNAFSLNTFLTNWNQLSGARKLIFPSETVQALDKLAKVADVAKRVEGARNSSKTGGVISRVLLHGGEVSGAGLLLTGHPQEAALAGLVTGLTAVRQYGAAKLLANPNFAKKLAATPMNGKAAAAFWSRPWVKAMQLKNPAIAGEIQIFAHTVANDIAPVHLPAAASNQNPNQ